MTRLRKRVSLPLQAGGREKSVGQSAQRPANVQYMTAVLSGFRPASVGHVLCEEKCCRGHARERGMENWGVFIETRKLTVC